MDSEPIGFVIMIGGRSRRMHCDKWSLPFGSQSFLQTLVEIGNDLNASIVVSIGWNQNREDVLQHVGEGITVVQDRLADQGPLEGIRQALFSLDSVGIGSAFVTGCDSPALKPEVVRRLVDGLDGQDGVVPVDDRHLYGLTAVYDTRVWRTADRLLAEGRNRVTDFVRELSTIKVPTDCFRDVDPELQSFENFNTPEDLQKLRRKS